MVWTYTVLTTMIECISDGTQRINERPVVAKGLSNAIVSFSSTIVRQGRTSDRFWKITYFQASLLCQRLPHARVPRVYVDEATLIKRTRTPRYDALVWPLGLIQNRAQYVFMSHYKFPFLLVKD